MKNILKEQMGRLYDVKGVAQGYEYWQRVLLSKIQNMFIYENLPKTIPQSELEHQLFIKGYSVIFKKKGELYAPVDSSIYWDRNVYNFPNWARYANPVLGSGKAQDGEGCAIVWNTEIDKSFMGSIYRDTINRYARLLADLESTYNSILIGQRTMKMGIAMTQHTAEAIDKTFIELEAGKDRTIVGNIGESSFKPLNFMPTGSIVEFSENRDYLINCFLNEIGLKTLEEKKERMITDEVNHDNETLVNNIDILYKSRIIGMDKINEVFGTNIKVYKNQTFATITEEEEDDEYDA